MDAEYATFQLKASILYFLFMDAEYATFQLKTSILYFLLGFTNESTCTALTAAYKHVLHTFVTWWSYTLLQLVKTTPAK
jgi:hypothetical protein